MNTETYTEDSIENLRNALDDLLHCANATGDAKVINECKAVMNTILDYTARLKGYTDYWQEHLAVREQVKNWHNMKVNFTPYPGK
jgi:hypothetical protein